MLLGKYEIGWGENKKSHIPSKNRSQFSQEKYKFFLNAPFEISSKCCDVMKKSPMHKYQRETGRKPITAQMASESRLRTQKWLQNGCNGFNMKSPISNPMSFWTEQDVLLYIYEFSEEMVRYRKEAFELDNPEFAEEELEEIYSKGEWGAICSVYRDVVIDYDGMRQIPNQMNLIDYGVFDLERPLLKTTGCKRTGCFACGYGCHLEKGLNNFEIIDIVSNPNMRDFCMRGGEFGEDGIWRPGRGGLGYWFVMKWINVHGGFDMHIPEYERYEEEYGDDRTRELLKE